MSTTEIAMPLTKRQIEYGFNYYFKDEWEDIDTVTTLGEYRGQTRLVINCTQLPPGSERQFVSAAAKKRVLSEWCNFLRENPRRFTQLAFGTRMPQDLFNAVCHQVNLTHLDIKWGVYKDLSAIANLQKLKLLHIGSGAGVESITPLAELSRLLGLSVENFQKISDYSSVAQLRKLESLTIEGYGTAPQYIYIQSLEFLKTMTKLRHLTLLTYRLECKDYQPILKLRNLEHLTLGGSRREVKACYEQMIALPKLKWGLLKTRPQLYEK
jgi:hypothetical protein